MVPAYTWITQGNDGWSKCWDWPESRSNQSISRFQVRTLVLWQVTFLYPPELLGLMEEFHWAQRAGKVQQRRADINAQLLVWTQVLGSRLSSAGRNSRCSSYVCFWKSTWLSVGLDLLAPDRLELWETIRSNNGTTQALESETWVQVSTLLPTWLCWLLNFWCLSFLTVQRALVPPLLGCWGDGR